MTEQELTNFQDEFDSIVHNAQKFAVFVRGIEFQEEQINVLKSFQEQIKLKKEQATKAQNEIAANTLLSLEEMNRALTYELFMLVYLKQDKINEAWDSLISAQMSTSVAMKAHPAGAEHLIGYVQKLFLYEKILFPNQMFFSTGLVAKYSECSICGKEYGKCNHLIGKPYMGKLCGEIVRDLDLKEVSIVTDPADKKCRAYTIEENGITKDLMTFRKVEKSNKHNKT